MKPIEQLENLVRNLAGRLDGEVGLALVQISETRETVTTWQEETPDPRLRVLRMALAKLRDRLESLRILGARDVTSLREALKRVESQHHDQHLTRVLLALLEAHGTLRALCRALLAEVVEQTGAGHGFVLLFDRSARQAQVVAARDFDTELLATSEYDGSRTIVEEVRRDRRTVLLTDALASGRYCRIQSIRELRLRSVLAVPLGDAEHLHGVIYLEDRRRPEAFGKAEAAWVEDTAKAALRILEVRRLLPFALERDRRVYLGSRRAASDLLGEDLKLVALRDEIRRVAPTPARVLIEGESGTGKELVARALHRHSGLEGRFVAVNCAALPATLIEGELFGHEKGAYTSATGRRRGRIEQAHRGTLFLDEIHELAPSLQPKLLRVLESREVDRLGGGRPVRVEVRVIAATSRDLRAMVAEGSFLDALYYRLYVVPLGMPALRERRGDIRLLTEHFLARFAGSYGRSIRLHPEVHAQLARYPFPGNVRELENLIERLVALARSEEITAADLPHEILDPEAPGEAWTESELLDAPLDDLNDLDHREREISSRLEERKQELVLRLLEETGHNVTEVAHRLNIHRATLHRWLERWGVSRRP